MTRIIDGKKIANQIREEMKQEVHRILNDLEGRAPHCAVILVGDNAASQTYVASKERAFKKAGMMSTVYRLDKETTQEELMEIVHHLNSDDEIDGILVQLPLPQHLDSRPVIDAINPDKDVDGLTPYNQGMLLKDEGHKPCTPLGVVEMLKRSNTQIASKHCVVIGRSDLVGRPAALLMLKENATVTITHRHTNNLKELTKQADILIVAMGKAGYINEDYIKEGAVIVDVGIHREAGEIVGDVDPSAYEKASSYTPVPGGVGPMTISMLLSNTLDAYMRKHHDA